ncbi:MAG TPA: DNA polymerase, partial [Rubrobacteraceae bacterium]|nr:DNA polymerase [Rubrobacteraceae bacterium]
LDAEEEEVGIGVVWDSGKPAFRMEIFPEYKAHRSSMPEELKVQLDHLDEILESMNVPAIRAEGFEADDALATLSKQVPEDVELYIVTGDQDAMQLVDGRVKVLRTTRGVSETRTYGRQEVIEEYGVTPEQIPDYKALVGDPSDNIPGVRGIGPKGAASLLQQFGSVAEIYENLDKISAKGTRAKLEEGRENAFISLELAKMRFDAPVEFDREALRFEGVSPESRDVLFRRYEFRSLEPRFAELPVAGGEELPPVERLAVRLSDEPIEPSFEPVGVAPVGDGRWGVAVAEDEVRISEGLPERPLRVHDAKKLGVPNPLFDTFLAAYLIKPGLGSYELDALASERGLAEVEVDHEDPAIRDAARRAAMIQTLSPKLNEELEEMALARLFYDVELPLAEVLGEMERVGMPVDARTLEVIGEEIEERVAQLEGRIYEDVGHPFNIGSPKQLGEVLFEELGLPPIRKTKTGYSTDAKVLQQLAIENPIAERIIEYRELTKLRGTYIEGLLKLIGDDGRIHTTLNQTTTATGRISSDSPNLQNIPVRSELGARIRDAFIASPGRRLVVADYSQIELRILAHMTGEPALVESFMRGEDIHTRTA